MDEEEDLYDLDLPSILRMRAMTGYTNPKAGLRPPRPGALDDPAALGEEEYGAEDMTQEDFAQLVGLGALGEDLAENQRQMEMAEKLRYAAAPEGRQAGRAYVAASPLEHLASGIDKVVAARDTKRLKKERGTIQEKQTAGRGKYWDILRGRKRKDQDFSGIEAPTLRGL